MNLFSTVFILSAVGAILASQSSCSSPKPQAMTFAIGQKVQVGKLFYQVIEAQWMGEVQGAKQPPKNRVLHLHLNVMNAGALEASVPFLRLIDGAGNEIMEMSDLEGNPRWLGMLRRMQSALTEDGFVYFDVPVGAYKLEVVDNTLADDEKIAYIAIPASLAPPPLAPGSPGN